MNLNGFITTPLDSGIRSDLFRLAIGIWLFISCLIPPNIPELFASDLTPGHYPTLQTFTPKAEGGEILSIISDKKGGFYIGGTFSSIDGTKTGPLVHVNSNNTIDTPPLPTPWLRAPEVAIGIIDCMVLSNDGNTLYIGGLFNHLGNSPRNNIAAINTKTGNVSDWNPTADRRVTSIALSSPDDTLFMGGNFKTINDEPRQYLASVNASTGILTPWTPAPNGKIHSLTLSADGKFIYISGEFTTISNRDRNNYAAMKLSDSSLTSWNPKSERWVRSLIITSKEIASLF